MQKLFLFGIKQENKFLMINSKRRSYTIIFAFLFALFSAVGLYRFYLSEQKWVHQGLVLPGNDQSYAKAIADSYKLLVERYIIPISPKLLYQSAKRTVELLEKNWLKAEKKVSEMGIKAIQEWEQEIRGTGHIKENQNIEEENSDRRLKRIIPSRLKLNEEEKIEQEHRFAAEYERFSAKDLRQLYENSLANSRLQGFYSKEFAQKLYEEILAALCRPLLDPFSGFFQESGFYQLSDTTNGSFGGVGLYITKQGKFYKDIQKEESSSKDIEIQDYQYLQQHYVKVSRPFPGGPSFRAGIVADDFIYEIDNKSAKDWTVEQVQRMVRGVPGSKVNITVLRARQQKIDFEVVREKIELVAVRSDTIPLEDGSKILYVELSQFNAVAAKQFIQQAQSYLKKKEQNKIAAMILDMRNNPGGLLSVAVKIADQFLSEGLIISTDARTEDSILEFRAKKPVSIPKNLPVYVMVNKDSASAAEIVAGALQDHQRALVLGQQSFGKGSVQIPVYLPEGILKLTIAHFYTPKGINLANNGIQPDQEFNIPSLGTEEQTGIVELLKDSIISGFVSQNHNYTDIEFQKFFEQKNIKEHYKVSEFTAKRIAYSEKMRYMKEIPVYNLLYDHILRNVVGYISEKTAVNSPNI